LGGAAARLRQLGFRVDAVAVQVLVLRRRSARALPRRRRLNVAHVDASVKTRAAVGGGDAPLIRGRRAVRHAQARGLEAELLSLPRLPALPLLSASHAAEAGARAPAGGSAGRLLVLWLPR